MFTTKDIPFQPVRVPSGLDGLLKQGWETSPCRATGQALGADSPTDINKLGYCLCEFKKIKENMGLKGQQSNI